MQPMDDATLLADVALERPADLPQRSAQIEQLARLTQQALDAHHRAGSGVEFANPGLGSSRLREPRRTVRLQPER